MSDITSDENFDDNELDRGDASISLKNLDEIDYVEHDELLSDEDIEIAETDRIEPFSDSRDEFDDDGAALRTQSSSAEVNFVCTVCFMTKNNLCLSKKSKPKTPICIDCE